MRVPRIYTSQTLAPGDTVELDSAASHYLARVLRMQAGRELVVFNGTGGEYRAAILDVSKTTVTLLVESFSENNRASPLSIDLAIGISRGERMDWVLQKATELGVSRVTPLFTERTEIKLKAERLEKKLLHWRQIMISACEQCQLNILPELRQPRTLSELCADTDPTQLKLVLHHRADQSLAAMNGAMQRPPSSVLLLVGPEGGLSEEEIELVLHNQFQPLKLGPRVLRTETAPIVVLTAVQQLWGDLNEIA